MTSVYNLKASEDGIPKALD